MSHLSSAVRSRLLLVILAGMLIVLCNSCMTNYNNQNWHRTPPSTGRNRCGCLIQKHYQVTHFQYGEINRA
ncbi:MAG: hypothetical protein IPH88_11660 [Bacteroidales bacterium]|nr:hypothetical protein [Bacteroidales bacterium]